MNDQWKKVAVVGGAGHVGLPLALAFSQRVDKVIVYDKNKAALEKIANGELPFIEEGAEPILQESLARGSLVASADLEDINGSDAIIVTIGTPIDEHLNPELKGFQSCLAEIAGCLNPGCLVVLRSTLFPGITDWADRFLKEKTGKEVLLSFCPERMVQGKGLEELKNLPQIVSATSTRALSRAMSLFSLLSPDVVVLDPMEAEFAKLFANAYRYIQFAAANQFYTICDSVGIDYYRVLNAVKYKYPRLRDLPGAGFAAGPCLLKDTMQLAAFCQNTFDLGQTAMLVNEGFPLHLIKKLEKHVDLSRSTVGILGMAFKADNDDIRSSLSYKLKRLLAIKAKSVLTSDPFVTSDESLLPIDQVVAQSDVIIIGAPHTVYRKLRIEKKVVIDPWRIIEQPAADVPKSAAKDWVGMTF